MKWKIQTKHSEMSVRDYLLHVRIFSRNLLKDVKDKGTILLNDEEVTVRSRLNRGDELDIQMPEEIPSAVLLPMRLDFQKVYEDEYLLVIRKESGLAVLPNQQDKEQPTLANAVMYDFDQRDVKRSFHIVTRLDRNTSGLVLIAKDRYTHHLLQNTSIERKYTAVIEGKLADKKGMIDLPIDRKWPSIIERKVSEKGKRAITHFRVTEEREDCSFVDVTLETGRTHQIRVHFSHIGHPLVGDDLYGGTRKKINRQALHCRFLQFVHPFTQKSISFYSHLPRELTLL